MPAKTPTSTLVLEFLKDVGKLLPMPFETPYAYIRRASGIPRQRYYANIYKLKRRGSIKVAERNKKKTITLTPKGELELLLHKAKLKKSGAWDGKWRLLIFDIPEHARDQRDRLRYLLKKNEFTKLQSSVFISPHSLNQEAITYLKTTGLIKYIRILRVDKMDDEDDLIKKFGLKSRH